MDDLTQFLRERYDEEALEAVETTDQFGDSWTVDSKMGSIRSNTGADVLDEPGAPLSFIARHDPARVLTEVQAKRRIVEWHRKPTQKEFDEGTYRTMGCRCYDGWPCTTLRALALPYAEHPNYKDKWRP